MRIMIIFHRSLFAFMLLASFFAGALDAGRQDLLNEALAEHLIDLSLRQLSNIRMM